MEENNHRKSITISPAPSTPSMTMPTTVSAPAPAPAPSTLQKATSYCSAKASATKNIYLSLFLAFVGAIVSVVACHI